MIKSSLGRKGCQKCLYFIQILLLFICERYAVSSNSILEYFYSFLEDDIFLPVPFNISLCTLYSDTSESHDHFDQLEEI